MVSAPIQEREYIDSGIEIGPAGKPMKILYSPTDGRWYIQRFEGGVLRMSSSDDGKLRALAAVLATLPPPQSQEDLEARILEAGETVSGQGVEGLDPLDAIMDTNRSAALQKAWAEAGLGEWPPRDEDGTINSAAINAGMNFLEAAGYIEKGTSKAFNIAEADEDAPVRFNTYEEAAANAPPGFEPTVSGGFWTLGKAGSAPKQSFDEVLYGMILDGNIDEAERLDIIRDRWLKA